MVMGSPVSFRVLSSADAKENKERTIIKPSTSEMTFFSFIVNPPHLQLIHASASSKQFLCIAPVNLIPFRGVTFPVDGFTRCA
jgi:hypothetical protein